MYYHVAKRFAFVMNVRKAGCKRSIWKYSPAAVLDRKWAELSFRIGALR